MKPVMLAAVAFAIGSVAVSGWLLSRSRAQPGEADVGASSEPGMGLFGFATWATHSDAVLLVKMEENAAHAFTPQRFRVVNVSVAPAGVVSTHDDAVFSWAPADRAKTVEALRERGFPMTNDDPGYPPQTDPLSGEPIRSATGDVQTVSMHSKGGLSAMLTRHRANPRSAMAWNRRALGFPSGDGRLVYVSPDEVVIPTGTGASP